MSVEAITWALRQPITHSSAKFVLVVLANNASAERAQAWPSVTYLAEATGQDRKTVMANLARLQEWGLISDTGKRTGATKQVVVYQLACGPDLFTPAGETVPKTGQSQKRDSPENGTVPKTPGNSPVFPPNSPKNGTRNRQEPKEPSRGERMRSPNGSRLPPDWHPDNDDIAFVHATRPELDLLTELAKFRDYWHGTAGAKSRKADWPATWRNWIRRADAPKVPPGQPVPGSTAPATPQRDWREPSETPLERDLAHIRQQHVFGAYGEGPEADAERDRLIAEARSRHGAAPPETEAVA